MFYERLKKACDLRNIAVNSVVKATLPSNGVVDNWKKGGSPRADAVQKIAKYLNVSSDYLLGLSDNPNIGNSLGDYFSLEESETALIATLRSADPALREAALRSVKAILNNPVEGVFLPSNDAESHHEKVKSGPKTRTLLKKIEGEAAAGAPITAVPEEDSFVSVPEKYLDERYFIVRARGNSMEDTISNGACCVFQRGVPLDDGAIALVQIEGATDQPDDTIKRVYRRGKQVELCSDNPKHESMFYPAKSVQIAGILVAVLEKDR